MVGRLAARGAVLGAAVVAAEAAYAFLRPAPLLPEFDPSGDFGDPSLPTITIAVLGDSSVTAPGVDHPDESWVRIVCHRLATRRRVELCSFAVGGSMSSDVLASQLDAALAVEPDVTIVSIGGNDAIHFVPIRRFERELDRIVVSLGEAGSTVVLSGVGDLGTIPRLYEPLRSIMTARSAAYHRVHHRVAARHSALVADQRDDDRNLWLRDRSLWSEDLFHVSSRGHARWAETAWRTLEPLGLIDG
jgi:lysophospholipase L1-like esterase